MRHGTEHAATLGQRVAILFMKENLSNSSEKRQTLPVQGLKSQRELVTLLQPPWTECVSPRDEEGIAGAHAQALPF